MDTDGDGIPDRDDNCPLVPNPQQLDDTEGQPDGVGNHCDNCLDVTSADQTDGDFLPNELNDELGNPCDTELLMICESPWFDPNGNRLLIGNHCVDCPGEYVQTQSVEPGEVVSNPFYEREICTRWGAHCNGRMGPDNLCAFPEGQDFTYSDVCFDEAARLCYVGIVHNDAPTTCRENHKLAIEYMTVKLMQCPMRTNRYGQREVSNWQQCRQLYEQGQIPEEEITHRCGVFYNGVNSDMTCRPDGLRCIERTQHEAVPAVAVHHRMQRMNSCPRSTCTSGQLQSGSHLIQKRRWNEVKKKSGRSRCLKRPNL